MSRRSWQIFLARPLYLKRPKKHEYVTKPTRATALWPEMHRSSCKGMFLALVSPGVHLVQWTRDTLELSYFVAPHMVH